MTDNIYKAARHSLVSDLIRENARLKEVNSLLRAAARCAADSRRHAGIARRLRRVGLDGDSHAMLSAICKAVYPVAGPWTREACEGLRERLAQLADNSYQRVSREDVERTVHDLTLGTITATQAIDRICEVWHAGP